MGLRGDDVPHGAVPPPLVYAALLVVTGIVHILVPLRALPAGNVQFGVGLPLIAVGLTLLAWAFVTLRGAGEHPDPGRPTEAVTTAGPYSFSRNPIYVAFTLVAIGVSLAVNSAWMIGGVPLALAGVWWGTVRREERYLQSKFGETYLDYKRRVRRWFLVI